MVLRGRPIDERGGMNGSSNAHSASVKSLAYRSPARRYCARVISVQGIVGSIESSQIRGNHNLLKSLNPFSVRLLDQEPVLRHNTHRRSLRRAFQLEQLSLLPVRKNRAQSLTLN